MQTISPRSKLESVHKYWSPAIVGEVNSNLVKVAKIKGQFVWHSHENEDELFIVLNGTLRMRFRDRTEIVNQGELIIVPRGVEHCPETDGKEVHIMLIEPASTLHTGDVSHKLTNNDQKWI